MAFKTFLYISYTGMYYISVGQSGRAVLNGTYITGRHHTDKAATIHAVLKLSK